jgi:hypothetical protein
MVRHAGALLGAKAKLQSKVFADISKWLISLFFDFLSYFNYEIYCLSSNNI